MDPFTVTQITGEKKGETWKRNLINGAKGLADNIARQRGAVAVVTLTETGWEEYRSNPADFREEEEIDEVVAETYADFREEEEIDEVERAVVVAETYEQN